MEKDFDGWNFQKKEINKKETKQDFFFYEREIWWSSVGINVGVESDGKNENFERPILIIKKFNGQMFWGVPLTSKERKGEHYLKVNYENGVSFVCLSQIKTMSTKRLLRKISMISEKEFDEVVKKVIKYLEI